MTKSTTTSTIRAGLDEQHKFEALRRYYEKKNYDETGEARRFTHVEVLRQLLNEPEIRAKWEDIDKKRRL